MRGSLRVASSISLAIVKQSSRVCGSGIPLIKLTTLCLVGLVFASGISCFLVERV